MKKNRSTWSTLLAVVLAMVVMAGLAVTSLAVTDGEYAGNEHPNATVEQLTAALESSTVDPNINVNYDIDGNGIVEWDDLAVLKGEALPDLLPNGEEDMLIPVDGVSAMQSLVVRGDSAYALALSADTDYIELDVMGDFSNYAGLTVDTLWPQNAGELTIILYATGDWYEIPVTLTATTKGWSTLLVDFAEVKASLPDDAPENALSDIIAMDIEWDGEHEVYIDNMQLVEANVTYSVGANGVTGLFDKYVIAGQPYGTLPTPVRPFYTFAGWYADAEYTNKVTADTVVAAGDSYTLYAKWEKDATVDTPMTEGGSNANLSVVPGKEDTYLYEVTTPSNYGDRHLNIDIQNVTAPVVSFDFTFTSANRATIDFDKESNSKTVSVGEQVSPAMYITDRQDNGVFGAHYVIVNADGTPVSNLELNTKYTVYITLQNAYHTSLKLAPMGVVDSENYTNGADEKVYYVPYVYSLEISALVEHHDAPAQSITMIPASGNHAMMSLYKTVEGDWQYAYAASNELPLLSYFPGGTYAQNTSYYRRIQLYADAATTEVRFDFKYLTAQNGDADLVNFGTGIGTVTIQNLDGTAVANPVVGQWYTAVIRNGGASLGTSFSIYTLSSNADGSDTKNVRVELVIKNMRAEKAITATDGSVTINGVLFNSDTRDYATTILHGDVKPLTVSISKAGAKQMRFKFKLTNAANFDITYVDTDSISYNNPNIVIVGEDGNAVKAANVVADKWYTAVIYSEIERYTSNSGTFWSSGEMCKTGTLTITTDGDLQLKEAEALSGQFGFRLAGIAIDMTRLDLSSYGYKYGYSINVNETSKYDTRIDFLNQRGLYNQLTFDFCITDFNGNTTAGADAELWFEGLNVTIYDPAGNALADHRDMVVGTWYTVKCDIAEAFAGEFAVSLYSFGENNATRLPYKAYLANINWTAADVMFDHEYTVKTATLERSGNDGAFNVDRVTKYDGRATYEVTASSANWSDRALKLSLLDSNKDFIQLDFCYTVSRNADGKHVTPSLNVYTTLTGTPVAAQYVILDENDNPVTELVTGNWYRLFINTNGGTQFAIVPETEGWVRVQFKDLESFEANGQNVAVTSDDPMNVSTSILLDRFGNMEYGYANYAGNTGVVTFTPNASTYKQIRFNFLLQEVGTMTMGVNSGSIHITDGSGNAVAVSDLAVGTQYTAVITNSGEALPASVKLTVGTGNTRMIIQNLAAYDTTDAPAAGTPSSIFHGIQDGEMMIAGFLGPREEYYNVHGVAKAPMIRDDIFKLLAESGINYIDDNSFSYSGTQIEAAQDALRLASKYGLNYYMGATDIARIGNVTSTYESGGYTYEKYDNDYVADYAAFEAKLAEMSQYKGFGGLHLRDEPGADLFAKIGQAQAHIETFNQKYGTRLNGFVNLLPGVGSYRWYNNQTIYDKNGKVVTMSSWSDYVRAYADIANPNYMSFDMYPIQGEAGQIEYAYFNYMGYFSTVAKEKQLPMAVCIQVGGGAPTLSNKRQATVDEMHWNVNTALAFGAEAMTYFVLVEPPYYGDEVNADNIDTHSAINVNGKPTPYFYGIQDINTGVKAIDHVIVNGTHKGVIFNGAMPKTVYPGTTTEISAPFDGTQLNKSAAKLSAISGNALIGVYEYEGKTALYVVNNSITSAGTIGLSFNGSYTYEVISDAKKSWQTGSSVSLNLGIGRAAMIIVHTESVSTDVLVSFELNYETIAPNPAGKFIATGNAYGELPTPVRPFHVFGGWYLNAECTGTKVESTAVMNELNDHALYAKWTPADLVITENNVSNSSITLGDETGSYIYTSNVGSAVSADSRALLLAVNASGKEIVKFSFMFETCLAGDGSALTPDMHVADVYNGWWRGACWVATDENGDPVANFEANKWYTLWITTEGQTSFRIYPMGQNVSQQVNVKMHLKDLEAMDADLPTNYVGNNPGDGSTFNHIGFYQSASGDWEMFHSAYNRYSEFLYGGVGQNTSYNRRVQLHLDSADYTIATFKFKYNVAQHKAAATEEDPNPVFAPNLNLGSSIDVTVLDANGNTVAVADRQLGVWYTAVLKKSDGSAIGTSATVYAAYGSEGKEGAYTEVEMLIKDVKAYKSVAHPTYTNADSSVTIQSNGIQDILDQDGNNIRYQLNAEEIPYISGSNAIKVTLNDSTKQVISMKFTVNTLTDVNGAASTPWVRVDTANRYDANYVVIDENGNACKTIQAGKTYTLWLTSPENAKNLYSQSSNTTEFVVYLVGKDTQSVADMTITEIASHAVSGVSVEGGSLTYQTKMHHANAGYYKYDGKWNLSYASYTELYSSSPTSSSNSAENREFFLTVNGENIEQMQFKFRWVEGSANGTPNYDIFFSGYTTTFYKNGVAVAVADRKAGEWYDVVVKKDGYVSGTITVYGLRYNNSYPINFQYQIADVEYMLGDPSPVAIASGQTYWVTLTRTGTSRYTLVTTNKLSNGASAAAWQRSFTLTNPLSTAAVLKVDFTFDYAYDAEGNEIASNLYATGLNYAIVEKDTGKLVGRCETGKAYTMFINVGASATATIYMGQGDGDGINAGITITNREVLEAPAAGDVTMVPNSIGYGSLALYQVDSEWRYGFTTYTGIQSTGASGHYYRRVYLKQAASTYDMLTFEFKYDVAQKVAADGTVTQVTDDLMISGAKYYTMDGVQVTNRTFTVGQWYKVVVTSATTLGESLDVFPLREQNRADTHELEITTAFRNFKAMVPDTSSVKVGSVSDGTLTRDVVDGKQVYTYTTRGLENPTNGSMSRAINISFPASQTHVAVQFRFTEAFEADGETPFAPYIGVYYGGEGNGGTYFNSFRVYDVNGKLVATNNNKEALNVGEWYTMVVTLKTTSNLTLYPVHHRSGDAPIVTMEIRDRFTYAAPESLATFSTPAGNFPEPNVTYYNGQWVQVISGNSATSATQENKRLAVTMANAGAGKLRFEMMMQNASGTAIPHMYGASGLKIYNMDGTALASNNTALDSGVWYIFEYETGANLGTSIIYLGYLGGGGKVGGLDAFIRNVQITEIGQVTINFNLGYDGAESITPATVEQGAAYGTLPTPAAREYYTFGGWYTNSACTGTAVTAETKVSNSHTLYAKWELKPDANPVKVGSVTDGSISCDVVDGEYVYTYTTAGKTTHGGNPKRKVNISFPTGQDYIYVEFRITESKTAAGADLTPYLRVYDPSNSGNGGSVIETVWIYDANGKQTAKNNSETGLIVGDWYTLVVKVKSGTNINMCPLSHYATDVPLVTMEIRERNCVDDNSNVVIKNNADYNSANATMTHSFVNGKSFFTYTTRGVSSPTTNAGNRRVEVSFPANQQSHVAIEFRYTEAFAADGTTAIAPTLRVYDKLNGGNGGTYISTVEIFDDNGNLVASGNATNSLTVGEWYTLVVGLKTDADVMRLWPCPTYTTDAAILTMEFRDWHAYTDPASDTVGIKKASGTYENIFPKTDGSVVYKTYPIAANTSAYNRRFNITNSADAALVKFDFVFDVCEDANGNPVTPNLYIQKPTSNTNKQGHYIVTDQNGDPVFNLETGVKYTMWITTWGNTSHDICVVGNSTAVLKAQMTITNREVVEVTSGAVTLEPNAATHGPLSLYKVGDEVRYGFSMHTGIQTVPTSGGAYARRLLIKQAASTYNQISFEFKYTEAEIIAADGTVTSGGYMATTGAKYYTLDGTEVSDTFTVGTWYKAVLTSSSTFGASIDLYPMAYKECPADGKLNASVAFRNLQAVAASAS